ncbi:MAG: sugar phosphate isomerase/epimerase family protein [Huintestinicola sp.]|uniref:sugar phosphate isomerase/epimerase family protein n=1 Tax=Huintestinicola sp. TaxID=2981661 RepID=UPI003F06F73F
MSKFLMIPQLSHIDESLRLAEEYGFGFEFNDFFTPDVLDSRERVKEIADGYKAHRLPDTLTCHGDFFDVLVFSSDKLIRNISEMRVRQSIEAALEVGAEAVIFHTNHNPFFIADSYVQNWLDCNVTFWSMILSEYPQLNIYIENMCDSSPDMLASLSGKLSSFPNYGVCFDYAHALVFGSDIESWVTSLAPYVKHMHINDNDLKSDLHLAVGDGKIDWNRFREHYFEYFTKATVLIETSSLENQRRSAEFLSKLGII